MPVVLVVDDEIEVTGLIRETLADEATSVVEAADGVEALRLAIICRPDIVFLDVDMPRLDGIETCRRIRQNPALVGARIVMITGHTDDSTALLAREAGADDVLTKPFSPLQLLRMVDSLRMSEARWN